MSRGYQHLLIVFRTEFWQNLLPTLLGTLGGPHVSLNVAAPSRTFSASPAHLRLSEARSRTRADPGTPVDCWQSVCADMSPPIACTAPPDVPSEPGEPQRYPE